MRLSRSPRTDRRSKIAITIDRNLRERIVDAAAADRVSVSVWMQSAIGLALGRRKEVRRARRVSRRKVRTTPS